MQHLEQHETFLDPLKTLQLPKLAKAKPPVRMNVLQMCVCVYVLCLLLCLGHGM